MFFRTVLDVSASSAREELAISDFSALGTLQIVVHLVTFLQVLVKCANVAVAKGGAKRRCIIVVRAVNNWQESKADESSHANYSAILIIQQFTSTYHN